MNRRSETQKYDIAIIGGGIIGLATAMALVSNWRPRLIVLEAEDRLATHQTGHNSGVIHSGLYYKPGSLKARTCVEGREALYRFCEEHGIAHERCGKLVVATSEKELPLLNELEQRGLANGLRGLRRLRPEEIRECEPHASGLAGLLVPETGIVDYAHVTQAFAHVVREADAEIQTGARVFRVHRRSDELVLETTSGAIHARFLINCGGLQADRIARMCGVDPRLRIIPFRGEYYELSPERCFLVRNLIYPVPDPRFPFLGVHFTRKIQGGVEAGPNAVLAFRREGYERWSFSLRDAVDTVSYSGFWKMVRSYWKTGVGEMYRSFSKRAFVKALQRLTPELSVNDIHRAGAGIRAQAVERTGLLVDDFRIVEAERMIHVLNAPSPAATASISIGKTIASMASQRFDLRGRSA
ncbi:MAG: L-2-hydroxyglutarate oxidase [candidate division WOR-3 bacterium]